MLIFLTSISAFIYASLVEYCLHRYVQHRSYEMDHIKNHHRIFHGIKSYEPKDAKAEDILSDVRAILINCVIYLIPSIMVYMQNRISGVIFLVACFLYNLWEEIVHLYSHKNTKGFLGDFYIFKRLKEHHRVHHYIYNSNYGIGTTFWDIVFRSRRTADKEREEIMSRRN